MTHLFDYAVVIFDCDGVILDSNELKIDAMRRALESVAVDHARISQCIKYFRENFGKSRFHHVDHFLSSIFDIKDEVEKQKLEDLILIAFSAQCRELYLAADLTPGVLDFIERFRGVRYVASGSEQSELRDVFHQRGLSHYFREIYGSPVTKAENVEQILAIEGTKNAVLIGDAVSDMQAAQTNGIDFVFYEPYSNVKAKMAEYCSSNDYRVITDFTSYKGGL